MKLEYLELGLVFFSKIRFCMLIFASEIERKCNLLTFLDPKRHRPNRALVQGVRPKYHPGKAHRYEFSKCYDALNSRRKNFIGIVSLLCFIQQKLSFISIHSFAKYFSFLSTVFLGIKIELKYNLSKITIQVLSSRNDDIIGQNACFYY